MSEELNAHRCIAPLCKPLGCSACNCAVPADVYAVLLAPLRGEIQRLLEALVKANDQAERFERGWYLRGDALQSIDAIATRCIGEPVTMIEDELIRIGTKCRAGLLA